MNPSKRPSANRVTAYSQKADSDANILRRTASVCPVCLKQVPASLVADSETVYLQKCCPEHGSWKTPVWRNHVPLSEWTRQEVPLQGGELAGCPQSCGLCPEHLRDTCCMLLPVTSRCNLHCAHCFAASSREPEPTFDRLCAEIQTLAEPGKTLLQLSGGEPTCRDDLPALIRAAKAAGCRYVQLNSNGIRLAQEPGYAGQLKEAGLSFVFLQFDGLDDNVYCTLRGKPLLEIKRQAITRCGEAGLGVTLVPMLVPGINTDQVGSLLRFAVSQSPAVRGIHFQPVSYFSRKTIPQPEERYTLDTLMMDIEAQTDGLIRRTHLLPSHCDHPRCGFHADFMVAPDGLLRLSQSASDCCCEKAEDASSYQEAPAVSAETCCKGIIGTGSGCCATESPKSPADRNRQFVGRRWERDLSQTAPDDISSMSQFLQRIRTHGFTVTAMAFMDAGNLDLERLRKCSLHVYDHGRVVPFCAYYLSSWQL